MGGATAVSELTMASALRLAIVPYTISLKRTSVLFSVLMGFTVLKEKNFAQTIAGAFIMFMGMLMITLG